MKRFDELVDTDATIASFISEDVQGENFDPVSFITSFENGELDQQDIINGFQHLLDSGIVYHLQGTYQHTLQSLIDAGLVIPPSSDDVDEGDLSDVEAAAWQKVMNTINAAATFQDFLAGLQAFTALKSRFAPIPQDQVIPFEKVAHEKAVQLKVVPEIANSDHETWNIIAPYLGTIFGSSGQVWVQNQQ